MKISTPPRLPWPTAPDWVVSTTDAPAWGTVSLSRLLLPALRPVVRLKRRSAAC